MAYAVERGSRRFVGSGGVILVHAALAYLLVFGLAAPEFIAVPETRVTGVPVTPPVEPPPPDKKQPEEAKTPTETTVHTPDPPIDLTIRNPVKSDPPIDKPLPPIFVPLPPVIANDGLDATLFTPTLARPINEQRWVTTTDYPRSSIRGEEQGIARFSVRVDARGKATDCSITRSSGSTALDQATCRNVLKRAKFDPATDKYGASVPGSYSNSVNWVLPE